MHRDIDIATAQIICGQIRMRRYKTCLFRTKTGWRLKSLHTCTIREIGREDCIGVYNRRVTWWRIHEDWNDTI